MAPGASSGGEHTGKYIEVNNKRLRVGQYFPIPPPNRNQKGYHIIGCGVRECNDQMCQERKTYIEEKTMSLIMADEVGEGTITKEELQKRKKSKYNALQKNKKQCITWKHLCENAGTSAAGSSVGTLSRSRPSGTRDSGEGRGAAEFATQMSAASAGATLASTAMAATPSVGLARSEEHTSGLLLQPLLRDVGIISNGCTDELFGRALGSASQGPPVTSMPHGSYDMQLQGPIPFEPPSVLPDALSSELPGLPVSDMMRPSVFAPQHGSFDMLQAPAPFPPPSAVSSLHAVSELCWRISEIDRASKPTDDLGGIHGCTPEEV